MSNKTCCHLSSILALLAMLALAGCGGGSGGAYPYLGDVEVDNQTDLSSTLENLYSFEMAPAGTQSWTGNLLSAVLYPGEVVRVGVFDEGFYDAEAYFEFSMMPFFDVFVQAGVTTTFQVY